MSQSDSPSPDDRAEAALAYALFDAENSSRLQEHPKEQELYFKRAKTIRYFLKTFGFDVMPGEREIMKANRSRTKEPAGPRRITEFIGLPEGWKIHVPSRELQDSSGRRCGQVNFGDMTRFAEDMNRKAASPSPVKKEEPLP